MLKQPSGPRLTGTSVMSSTHLTLLQVAHPELKWYWKNKNHHLLVSTCVNDVVYYAWLRNNVYFASSTTFRCGGTYTHESVYSKYSSTHSSLVEHPKLLGAIAELLNEQ